MPHSNKKKGKKNASNASSSANSNSGLSNSSSPGSSKGCTAKSNQIKQKYRKDTKSLHKILTDKKSTMSQKRRASESLGERPQSARTVLEGGSRKPRRIITSVKDAIRSIWFMSTKRAA